MSLDWNLIKRAATGDQNACDDLCQRREQTWELCKALMEVKNLLIEADREDDMSMLIENLNYLKEEVLGGNK